nr:MAG TPA: hypothetical protein [Caudoviricetes sp.]
MNVKQLIEKIHSLPAETHRERPYVDRNIVFHLILQLKELEDENGR